MPAKLIGLSLAGCLALAGAWSLAAAPQDSNAQAMSTIPPESGGGKTPVHPGLPDDLSIVNSTICLAIVTHASLDHSPVCTIAQDHAQGVNQPHNVIVECPECPSEGGEGKTIVQKTVIEKTIVRNGTGADDGEETVIIVHENETTVHDDDRTRDDTCAQNQETTCDQSEDNRETECEQSNEDALVNANVCNVFVEPVKDINVNDAVDVVRGDVNVEDPDVVDVDATLNDTVDVVDNAVQVTTGVLSKDVTSEVPEG